MATSPGRPGILSVVQLTRLIKDTLTGSFPSVWVRGEITNVQRAPSGHFYFDLKEGREAILPFLGKRFALWPKDAVKEAKALSVIGFFAASVHPANAHVGRPERYTEDKAAFPGIQEMGKKTFFDYLKQIDGMYAGREWLSDQYSVLDPYAFVFYTWAAKRGQPVAELKNYTAMKDRMLKRPAVQRVVADEGVKL